MSQAPHPAGRGERLVNASEIAQIAGVQPSAVSNWRKRFADFPGPAGTAPSGGDLFRLSEVETWLRDHDRLPSQSPRQRRGDDTFKQIWAVADRLRGKALAGDLLGALAAGAALVHLAQQTEGDLRFRSHELGSAAGEQAQAVGRRLVAQRPELDRLFAPLFAVDLPSLGLLLDALTAVDDDELPAALDFVLERAARYSEFRTAEPAAKLLIDLAHPHGCVFDPAVGSAELLIEAAQQTDPPRLLFGQELNESSWRVGFARLLLRNIDAQIELGDSLLDDRHPNLRADVVFCDPPVGARTADLGQLAGDPRWQLLGRFEAPPPRVSEFAWLAHVIHHLAPDGRGYVLLSIGTLFRRGAEARFRAELLRQGMIEAIITLPHRSTTTATSIAFALWIVRPVTTAPGPVLLVDSTNHQTLNSELRARLKNTVTAWRHHPDEFEATAGFATTVPVLELLAGDAPLVPARWLYEPQLIDVSALIDRVERAQRDLEDAHKQLSEHAAPVVSLRPAAEPRGSTRVRELIELGQAELLRPARIKTEAFGDEGAPVWLPADVNEPWRRDEQPRFVDPELVDSRSITQPGDIVFTTVGGIRTRVDDEGGHVLGTSLQALRLAPKTLDPHAVAALLTNEPNRRLLTGTTIPRVNVLELEVPRIDRATATRIRQILRSLEKEQDVATAVAVRAESLRQSLVDAVASGAAVIATSEPEHD